MKHGAGRESIPGYRVSHRAGGGAGGNAAHSLPATLLAVQDLGRRVTGQHAVVFSEGETRDGDVFYIDGKTFDPNRIDTRVRLGAIEEWTIRKRVR
jgi:FtsP/CotA-like multicopper oxidase with cupredoxin domain